MMRVTLNNGVQMPALGLGVFQSPPEQTAIAVESALAEGTVGAFLSTGQEAAPVRSPTRPPKAASECIILPAQKS